MKKIKTFEGFNLPPNKDSYMNKDKQKTLKIRNDFRDWVSGHDISNWVITRTPYQIDILPDDEFLSKLNSYCLETNERNLSDNKFVFNVSTTDHKVDFEYGIPKCIRGLGLGTRLYKKLLNYCGYLTSNSASPDAINVWMNLMNDNELYCFRSNTECGSISTLTSDDFIKEVLEKIKGKGFEFDPILTQKIIELYGSMDIYQGR